MLWWEIDNGREEKGVEKIVIMRGIVYVVVVMVRQGVVPQF